jgi:hypothetical protein
MVSPSALGAFRLIITRIWLAAVLGVHQAWLPQLNGPHRTPCRRRYCLASAAAYLSLKNRGENELGAEDVALVGGGVESGFVDLNDYRLQPWRPLTTIPRRIAHLGLPDIASRNDRVVDAVGAFYRNALQPTSSCAARSAARPPTGASP